MRGSQVGDNDKQNQRTQFEIESKRNAIVFEKLGDVQTFFEPHCDILDDKQCEK